MLSDKAAQKFKNSGKSFWDFFADWIKSAADICARRGVEVAIERNRTFLLGFSDPNTGLAYYDEFRLRSPLFPGAEHPVGGQFYVIFDGDERELANNILGTLSYQSGVPIPALPDAQPVPKPAPQNPVGPAIDGMPGYFFQHPYDASPDGAAWEPSGPTGPRYVKRLKKTPFGGSSWWEQVR